VPSTVTDQIRLWEMEKNRLESTLGWLFRDFNTMQEFTMVLEYAQTLGWVMWHRTDKRMFFCRAEGKGQVIEFINRKILKAAT
jgi:transcription initiation factor TFIIH subunit 4